MTETMSLWALIDNASLTVLLVLVLLVTASVTSWALIIQRGIQIKTAKKNMISFEDRFWSGGDLMVLYNEIREEERTAGGLESIFKAGFSEFTRLINEGSTQPDAVMEGTQRAMRVVISRELEKLEAHLPFLASVGSTCPYLGLFGTVVGIMNSFRGLAIVHQPTLASVAPGIAEALLTTAAGLVAAIPAVVVYNSLCCPSRGIAIKL